MTVSTEELLREIRQLRAEMQQMRNIVNSLVSIIIDVEGMDEETEMFLPDSTENFLMYN
ncbi:MAG: hypothetical protein KAS16_03480 [Thermoplasmata archaeon]|nr:hypothetical protein [Thermoplasmata archaeon]